MGENHERHSGYAVLHAMGDGSFACFQIFAHLVIGWPFYLMGLASTGRLGICRRQRMAWLSSEQCRVYRRSLTTR